MPSNEPTAGPRGPIAWMAGNTVAANLLMLVLLVGGFLYGSRIKQEVFPEFDLDLITVTVPYPGASPAEIEQSIVLAIEEAARGIDGVEEVTSVAAEGSGTVTAELSTGADSQKVAQDFQNEIDRITSFPEDAEEPRLSIATRRREVISLVLFGDVPEGVLREAAEAIRDEIQQDPGITLVELDGVRPYEISAEVSQAALRAHDLTVDQVAARLRQASVELPGGGIKTEGGEVLLRMNERRDFGREFERIPIIDREDGTPLYLEDIATIIDGFEDVDRYLTYDGVPAAVVTVYRVGTETPIAIADAVKGHVDRLNQTLPDGLSVAIWEDRSEIYAQRADLLLRNASIGLVLVFILLSVFLESRLAFWVMMGIPISFLGSFLLLPLMGVSLNIISMFAFIISLGIVVDDAIVAGENIYDHHQRGLPFRKAAAVGAQEVAMPITFSVLSNMVAFMPLFFVPGFMGKVFKVIPAVVVTVFFLSLVESLFILPAHLSHQKDIDPTGIRGWLHHRQQGFSRWFAHLIKDRYGPLLRVVLANRYIALAAAVAILLSTLGFIRSGRMGMTLFPRIEADYAFAQATLPFGSSVERTRAVQQTLLDAATTIAERHGGKDLVKGMRAGIGAASSRGGGGHVTEVSILLTDPSIRPVSTTQVINEWREEVGRMPGLESLVFQSDRGGPGSGAALTVELSHRNLEALRAACGELAEALADYPIVKDINDGFAPGKRQLDFTIRPEGQSLGLTARDVARQVRNAFYGAEVLRQQRGRNEMKIMVRLSREERESEYTLEELMLRTPAGTEVLLRDVVDTEDGRAYTTIDRRDGRRVVSVTADVTPPSKAGQILGALQQDTLPTLVRRYPGLSYGFEGQQAERRESMGSLMRGFLLAMLAMYALLAIPFRSYIQPLIIMICIPFGLVGAVLGHLIMGYSLSVLSMFGIVALSGVVVNDSLILVDFANRTRREGASPEDAIHAAGVRRFRPIMLTTLTTFGGLAPMIFETSRQARFLIPMAISLGYGILFATVITLALVPSLYLIIEDVRHLGARLRAALLGKGKTTEQAEDTETGEREMVYLKNSKEF